MPDDQEMNPQENSAKADSDDVSARKPLSRRKKILYSLIACIVVFVGIELGARVVSFVVEGFNPYYLLYGFKAWKTDEGHSVKMKGYFKFPANRTIKFGTPEPARINNHGFRGPDFEAGKPNDSFRVLCMGASSTFGYTNRDTGTYPAILQRLFDERAPELNVEVINVGVPHMNTDNLLAMLKNELVEYHPDVITVYTGYNDATWPMDETSLQRLQRWLDGHSAAYATLRKVVVALGGRLHNRFVEYLPRMSRETVERQLALHVGKTRSNLEELILTAQRHKAEVILIEQPMTGWPQRVEHGAASGPRPFYEEEYRMVVDELERKGRIPGYDVPIYIHHALMKIVQELSRKYNVALINNIGLVDAHPEGLATSVHLTEEANARLAQKLYAEIAGALRARHEVNQR